VFRRTDLATGAHPGDSVLRQAADLAAAELGWSEQQIADEIRTVCRRFPELPKLSSGSAIKNEVNG
jgi:hypothetical protein